MVTLRLPADSAPADYCLPTPHRAQQQVQVRTILQLLFVQALLLAQMRFQYLDTLFRVLVHDGRGIGGGGYTGLKS